MRPPQKLTFPGADGQVLAGRLDQPATQPRAVALFAHCFTCGKDIAAASRIAAGLVAEGFAVLRFDFTGIGSSEGEFENTSFASNVEDLVAAADHLRLEYEAPSLLVGHSLGGAAVLAAATQIDEVAAVATIGAPADPAHVTNVFSTEDLERIREEGEAEVSLAGRPFRVGQGFIDDVCSQSLHVAIERLGAALLVLHSPVDEIVGIENAREIHEAARHPKSFISIDGADHLLTDRSDAAFVASVLSSWAARYLPDIDPHDHDTNRVVVEEAHDGAFAQDVHMGSRHHLRADEPEGVGDDSGPTPYDLLGAALGTCTSMTIRMYARRKKLPLDHVRVEVWHERTHSDDCGPDADGPCKVEVLHRRIELLGDLDDEQRSKLADIADRCPVHRTLGADLRVQTELL